MRKPRGRGRCQPTSHRAGRRSHPRVGVPVDSRPSSQLVRRADGCGLEEQGSRRARPCATARGMRAACTSRDGHLDGCSSSTAIDPSRASDPAAHSRKRASTRDAAGHRGARACCSTLKLLLPTARRPFETSCFGRFGATTLRSSPSSPRTTVTRIAAREVTPTPAREGPRSAPACRCCLDSCRGLRRSRWAERAETACSARPRGRGPPSADPAEAGLDAPRARLPVNIHAIGCSRRIGRGAIKWAIIRGRDRDGIKTSRWIREGTGDVRLGQATTIGAEEKAGELAALLARSGRTSSARTPR